MQLLIILALLMLGGKQNAELLSEVKPVLESIGGEEIQQAIKSAEEISSVLTAVKSMASAPKPPARYSSSEQPVNFPLAPVSKIADKDITYSLSQYINAS